MFPSPFQLKLHSKTILSPFLNMLILPVLRCLYILAIFSLCKAFLLKGSHSQAALRVPFLGDDMCQCSENHLLLRLPVSLPERNFEYSENNVSRGLPKSTNTRSEFRAFS